MKTEDINREEVKKEILDKIDNSIFWEIVNIIDWRMVMGEKSEITKERLYDAIKQVERKEKLNKIDGRDYIKIEISYLKEYYDDILSLLEVYFKPVWLSDDCDGPSDDGYWDLRSSIIGFGQDFLIRSLGDDKLFLDMAKHHHYAENFGYIFH